jgi:hypothetical protein
VILSLMCMLSHVREAAVCAPHQAVNLPLDS